MGSEFIWIPYILGRKLKIMQCPLAPCRCRDGIMRFSRLAAIIIQHCFILGITSLNVFPIVAECQFCSSQWAFCFSCHISTATRNMLASPAMGWVPHATRIHEVRLFPCPAWCRLHLCKACAQLAQLIIRSARDLVVQDHFHSSNFGRSVECGGSGGWAVIWGRTSSAPIAWQWEHNISHSFNLPLKPCLVSAISVNQRWLHHHVLQ